ncbi:MAG: phenylalanine--tRNA ligase subunit alpha [Alphaproteobacteria bacterium]|nr:phenylalanine--tRNA ligase subunit alpha [Alphaproteobacteria bacterium]MDE1987337.1 phenylalanine--tRNA ligase subunit alpha [Alphaproteobacteria bacterium]MDE2161689.1 phenylalanine--tRNA ligase subunit alpha [Alphaproteobacteria bacterium]MDE2265185.1 phenylalanine--tRNA ligase subunit alpha [Alphaproteobacteria bacterium]MDE2500067.1 phenylalanine--tRNA ligase subunit alpha [Alphaproteobacteria bacterium]
MSDIQALERQILDAIASAADEAALEAVRVSVLGKKGSVSELLKSLGGMTPDERKSNGPLFNGLRDRATAAIAARKTALEEGALNARLTFERVDISLPVRPEPVGSVHPVSQVLDEVTAIFADLGFAVAEGPDVEFDDYNFTKLNIPPDHPARQMHDTFYVAKQADGSQHVLRTHTSPVQVRTMLQQKPPIRIISPGRTYRVDSDATHSPMFHQFEGLVIDEVTHLGHLKWTLEEFCKAFFEVDKVEMRARPSFFPFTEPSVEWDLRCDRSGGQIKFGQGNDWLELAGSGMVHPRVLELCGIDSKRYQGYAFGGGIDRLAMLKYGIPDIRSFFESDLRWLRHYGFAALDLPTLDGGLSR